MENFLYLTPALSPLPSRGEGGHLGIRLGTVRPTTRIMERKSISPARMRNLCPQFTWCSEQPRSFQLNQNNNRCLPLPKGVGLRVRGNGAQINKHS
jgi:hypothetical protein